MRKYLYVALACLALALVAPAAQARTTTAHATTTARPVVHVLTIGKLGGKAVRPKAKLEASLAKGTVASYSISGYKFICHVVHFVKIVITNPPRRGIATLSNIVVVFRRCAVSIKDAKVTSVTVQNLPYDVSASDAKGDPVTVSGTSPSAPLEFTANIAVGTLKFPCSYSAPSMKGRYSNKTHTVIYVKQPFTNVGVSKPCPPGPALLNAKLGPLRDFSVTGHPIVYVN